MRARFGLRERLIATALLAVLAGGLVVGLVSQFVLRERIGRELEARAGVLARALEGSAALRGAQGGPVDQATAFLDKLVAADADLVYLLIFSRGAGEGAARTIAWAARAQEGEGAASAAGVAGFDLATDAGRRDLLQRAVSGEWQEGDGTLHSVVKLASEAGVGVSALIGMSPERDLARYGAVVVNVTLVSGIIVIFILWWFSSLLARRAEVLKAHAARIASGDLTQTLDDGSTDEFGDLARALDHIVRGLGKTIAQVRGAAFEMDAVSHRVKEASRQIASDAGTQAMSVRQTGAAMGQMSRALQTVESEIGDVTRTAQVSTARLHDISRAVDRLTKTVQQVAEAIGQTRDHLERNSASLQQVDQVVARLNNAAEGTAAATARITGNINSVERSTDEALQMSRETSAKSESGVRAVKENLEGIQRIRAFTNETTDSVRVLSQKVASIERILGVIDDIANQTKLLSLNASIIAAGAGEHGRGFLVVAEAIKALAAKTAGSTREISAVIDEVMRVAARAIEVTERGVHTVDDGVQRSEHADQVLSSILEVSMRSGALARTVAAAMAEQSRSALEVNDAVKDVHSIAVDVKEIVAAQKTESSALEASMRQVRGLMDRSFATTKEQMVQVTEAIDAIGNIFKQIEVVSTTNADQVKSRSEVAKAFEVLESLSERHRRSARELSSAVEQVSAQSIALSESVRVFRV